MSDASTIIGVVAFVVIFVTAACIFERTHKRCFAHIDQRNEHALLKQDHRDEATERREQRDHERDIARSKRASQIKEHEREMAHMTSAHTASAHTDSHDTNHREAQERASERHTELLEAIKSRRAHETHGPSSATHNSASSVSGSHIHNSHSSPAPTLIFPSYRPVSHVSAPHHSAPHQLPSFQRITNW